MKAAAPASRLRGCDFRHSVDVVVQLSQAGHMLTPRSKDIVEVKIHHTPSCWTRPRPRPSSIAQQAAGFQSWRRALFHLHGRAGVFVTCLRVARNKPYDSPRGVRSRDRVALRLACAERSPTPRPRHAVVRAHRNHLGEAKFRKSHTGPSTWRSTDPWEAATRMHSDQTTSANTVLDRFEDYLRRRMPQQSFAPRS